MQLNSYRKYAPIFVLVIAIAGVILFIKKGEAPEIQPLQPPLIGGGELVPLDKGEVENASTPAEATPQEGNTTVSPAPTYRELITAGHKLYLREKYAEALPYFKTAAMIEQSDRIFRSLYSVYMGLKDYKNAEIAIKKS